MNKRVIVCGIVQNGNQVLLGKKEKGRPPYPDVWHTLGGGVKDFSKAKNLLKENKWNDVYFKRELQRELKEEANVRIKDIVNICPEYRQLPRISITKNKKQEQTEYIFLEYLCVLDSDPKNSKPGDDIVQLQWVNKNRLKEINLTPPSLEMYKELGWI